MTLRRTPLQRKTPLRSKTGLKTKAPMKAGGTRMKARSTTRRSMGKADPRWRSRKYLDWVKTLPCVMCGAPADDPHHIKGVGGMSGAGLTAPDWAVMPVCRQHHDEIHATPELWPNQWEWIARTLGKALEEGVIKKVIGIDLQS